MGKETTTKSQLERNKAYADKHPEKVRYLRARSSARSFIRTKAELEDLEELRKLIDARELELKITIERTATE